MTPAVGVQGAGLAEPFSKPGLPRSCVIPPLVTVRVTVVVWLVVPPTPVMVTVAVPRVAVDEAVKVTVEVPEPGAAIEAGLKEAVTPAGRPEAEREMAEVKPPEAAGVMVELPEALRATETALGDAEMVKSGVATAVTVRLTVAVWVVLPPVPVMVTVEVPRVAVGETVKVSVELPAPGAAIEDGLKEAVTPAGRPEAESAMAELKPPETAVVIVEVLVLPCTTETEVGAAAIVKSGVVTGLGVTEMQVEGAEAQASLPVGKAVTW